MKIIGEVFRGLAKALNWFKKFLLRSQLGKSAPEHSPPAELQEEVEVVEPNDVPSTSATQCEKTLDESTRISNQETPQHTQEEAIEPSSKQRKASRPPLRKFPTEYSPLLSEDNNLSSQAEQKSERLEQPKARSIDLARQKSSRVRISPVPRETMKKEEPKGKEEQKEERKSWPLKAPYVELDLETGYVFLVIPQQRIMAPPDIKLSRVRYIIQVDDQQFEQFSEVTCTNNNLWVKEQRVELEAPFRDFSVTYPPEMFSRDYKYVHPHPQKVYIFIWTSDNRARMYYLDRERGIVPQRSDVILLAPAEADIQPEPYRITKRWIWEEYWVFYLDLRHASKLLIGQPSPNLPLEILCRPEFALEGSALVADDFVASMPLFTEGPIRIVAPQPTPHGWAVWIQSKKGEYCRITAKWTGDAPLELPISEEPPWEAGEFQVDIYDVENNKPLSTLFLRYVPEIRLEEVPLHPLLPDDKLGHTNYQIRLYLPPNWKITSNIPPYKQSKSFIFLYPSEQDVLRFCVMEKDKPHTQVTVQVTIPRVRWRFYQSQSPNKVPWRDKPLQFSRERIIPGEVTYLQLTTGMDRQCTRMQALLETSGEIVQEREMKRLEEFYTLELNALYDTICDESEALHLKVLMEIANKDPWSAEQIVAYFPAMNPVATLDQQAYVITGGRRRKKRKGRGFSFSELEATGLGENSVRRAKIKVDKRRKTAHSWNIEKLRKLVT